MLVINFKSYEQGFKQAETIAKAAAKYNAVVCPPFTLLRELSTLATTFSQHVDPYEYGAHTGSIIPVELASIGVKGCLINHSERRVSKDHIEKSVTLCKKYGLTTIVCAKDDKEAAEYAKFGPDYIAVEPPELIGGNVSVSSARPELISDTVNAVHDVNGQIKVLCGAGVKTGEDVRKALELGACGVLVASGIVKADNPEEKIKELSSPIRDRYS